MITARTSSLVTAMAAGVILVAGADVCNAAYTRGSNWCEATSSAPWEQRAGASCTVFDDTLWLLGGKDHGNEAWKSSDGTNWVLVTTSLPWQHDMHHQCVSFKGAMWVLGGQLWGTTYNDVWSSTDGSNWAMAVANAPWHERSLHAVTVFNGAMWILGGDGSKSDMWYTVDGTNWSRSEGNLPEGGRDSHQVVAFKGCMWLLGGMKMSWTPANDVWYSPDGTNWHRAVATAPWSARGGHQCFVDDNKIWLVGGGTPYAPSCNDVWYSTDGSNWTCAIADAPWEPRSYHQCAVHKERMWVVGGATNVYGDGAMADVWSTVPSIAVTITNPTPPLFLTTNALVTIAGTSFGGTMVGWHTHTGSNGIASGVATWVAASIPLAAGSNVVTAWTSNEYGEIATDRIIVTEDAAQPLVQTASLSARTSGVGRVSVSLWFDKPMDTSVAVAVAYEPDSVPFSGCYSGATTWTGSAPIGAGNDGIKNVSVATAQDAAGITMAGTNGLLPFLVDTTPPDVPTHMAPPDGSYSPSTSIRLAWSLGTDMTGISGASLMTNGTAWSFVPPTNEYTVSFCHLTTNTWSVRTWDAYGNTSAWSVPWIVCVDSNQPSVTLVSPPHTTLTNVPPRLMWSTSGFAPVASNVVALDAMHYDAGTANSLDTPMPDGTHTWAVATFNVAGMSNTTAAWQFRLDTTPPQVTNAWIGPTTAHVGQAAIQLEFSEPMQTDATALVQFGPDGGVAAGGYIGQQTWSGTAAIVAGTDGIKTFSLSNALDLAGNTLATNGLAPLVVDTTAPSAPEPISPPDGAYCGSPAVTLQWTPGTDAFHVAGTVVETNGGAVVLGPTNSCAFAARQGSNTWRVSSFDDAGNTSLWSASSLFIVDANAPVVTLTSPPDGLATNDPPTLSWLVASLAPLASNVLTLDGVAHDLATSTTFVTAYAEGSHTWQVASWNTVGGLGDSEPRTFVYDSTPPSLMGAGSADSQAFHRGINTVRVDVVDNASGIDWTAMPEVRLSMGDWPAVRVYHAGHSATKWVGTVYLPHYYGDGTSSVMVAGLRDYAGNEALPATATDAVVRVCTGGTADIPGGFGLVGSMQNADEQPVFEAYIADFQMDRYEVANEAYAQFIEAGGYTNPALWTAAGWTWKTLNGIERPIRWTNTPPMWATDEFSNKANSPVVGVSWHEARAFAAWALRRLPTEAEWEYAARTPDNRGYTWGNNFWLNQTPPTFHLANWALGFGGYFEAGYTDDGASNTAVEGSYPQGVSSCGVCDLAGNANEWVADWYAGSYNSNDWENPPGPPVGQYKVLRGGSFITGEEQLRTSARAALAPETRSYDTGFRTAATITNDRPPAIATTSLVFPPTNGCLLALDAVTNILWRSSRIYDTLDGMNVFVTRISVCDTTTLAEVELIATNLPNLSGSCVWMTTGLVENATYVLRIAAMDQAGNTTNRVFFDNSFSIVPEPAMAAAAVVWCCLLGVRKKRQRRS